jgi:hypothetical protein
LLYSPVGQMLDLDLSSPKGAAMALAAKAMMVAE